MSALEPAERYKLLVSTVMPRPIALVTSVSEEGVVNAAPFSFFNAVGSSPPLVVLGIGNREPGVPKDSAANILARKEFVVNLVDEALAEIMNLCAVDFPEHVSEVEALGLELVSGTHIAVPRLSRAPVALECRLALVQEIGANRVLFGEVVSIFLREELVDTEKLHVNFQNLHLVGRMGGAGGYTRTRDTFQMARLTYAQWQALQEGSGHTEG